MKKGLYFVFKSQDYSFYSSNDVFLLENGMIFAKSTDVLRKSQRNGRTHSVMKVCWFMYVFLLTHV